MTEKAPRIIIARASDMDLFDQVAPGVFDEPIDPTRLRAYLGEPNHFIVLAMIDALVVGQTAAVVHRHPDKPTELYLDEVGVGDHFLKQGIAGLMVESALEEGRARGCKECWLGTEVTNVAARSLYRRWQPDPEPFVMYLWDIEGPTVRRATVDLNAHPKGTSLKP